MRRILILSMWCVCFLPAFLAAQTSVSVQGLREEITLSAGDLMTQNLSEDLLEAIESGAVDARQQISFDAPARQMIVKTFTVTALSLAPTPLVPLQNALLEKYKVDVTEILLSGNTLKVYGTIAAGVKAPMTGAVEGAPFEFSTTFYGTVSATFLNTLISIGGGSAIFAVEGAGSIDIGDSANHAPVVIVPLLINANSPEVAIDASQTYDPDGDELDFKWKLLYGAASLRGCETSMSTWQLFQGTGTYEFELTVTDSRGATTTVTIFVKYSGPFN